MRMARAFVLAFASLLAAGCGPSAPPPASGPPPPRMVDGYRMLGHPGGTCCFALLRGTAAWALGQLEGQAAPAGLLRALRDQSKDVRLKAAWALGQTGTAAAQPALREALGRETEARTRLALVRALMKSGERSERTLTDLLSSRDPQVREAAVRGLAGNDAFEPWPWPEPRPRPFP